MNNQPRKQRNSDRVREVYKIKNLEQVRLLSDPLKLQLLQAFAEDPRTTKQIAAELGERVTKLYRHVDALLNAGLLRIVDEKQKRGTVERTFRAIARRFEVDQSLFAGDAGPQAADAAREMLRASETEVVAAVANARGDDESQALVMRVRGRASPERIAELRVMLEDWLDAIPGDEQSPDDDSREFGGLIAFYLID